MTKSNNPSRLAVFFASRLACSLVSITLIACSQDKQGEDGVRIEAIAAESSVPMFDAGSDKGAGASRRLVLDFDSSPFYSSSTYNFFRLGEHLSYETDQGHRKAGSIRVSNRTAVWEGPLLTLPPLETESYTVSAWIKLINTQRTARVKLILMQAADSGSVSVPLTEVEVTPGAWQKVEGRIAGLKSENNLHVLRFEVEGTDIDYLVDDILIEETALASELETTLEPDALAQAAPAPGIVFNGGLESGLEPWTYLGGVISRSKQQAYSGDYSLLITDRTEPWHAPTMMLNGLEDNRLYRFSIFVRLTEEFSSVPVQLTLKQVIGGESFFLPIANAAVSNSGWTEVAGSLSVPDFSKSQELSLYLESVDPLASYYVDNLTIEPQ